MPSPVRFFYLYNPPKLNRGADQTHPGAFKPLSRVILLLIPGVKETEREVRRRDSKSHESFGGTFQWLYVHWSEKKNDKRVLASPAQSIFLFYTFNV